MEKDFSEEILRSLRYNHIQEVKVRNMYANALREALDRSTLESMGFEYNHDDGKWYEK